MNKQAIEKAERITSNMLNPRVEELHILGFQ